MIRYFSVAKWGLGVIKRWLCSVQCNQVIMGMGMGML